MIRKLIISVVSVFLIIFLVYMFKDEVVNNTQANSDRFIEVYDQGRYRLLVDKNTKVTYMQSCIYGFGGFTVLVNEEGKPLLWKE